MLTYMVEEGVALGKVDDIEVNGLHEVTRVLHPKIEPLKVARAVRVVTHEQVESGYVTLPHLVQISTLEVGVEGDFRLELRVERYALTLRISYRFGLPCID